MLTVAALLLAAGTSLLAANPAYYTKRATWQDTLLASRQAMAASKSGKARTALPDLGRTPFTIMAWVRTKSDGTILSRSPAKGKWQANGKAFFIRGGRLSFDIGWVDAVSGKRKVADGLWHHVALVRDKNVVFYVDGKVDAQGELEFPPDNPKHVVKVGYTSDDFPSRTGFTGEIDEIRLYGRAMTGEQIVGASQGAAGSGEGLVAHWPFESKGKDATGGRNDLPWPKGLTGTDGKVGKAVKLDGKGLIVPGSARGSTNEDRLWKLLEKDFPGAAAQRERQREVADGIWEDGCMDPRILARRYADAPRIATLSRDVKKLATADTDAAALQAIRAAYHEAHGLRELLADSGLSNLAALRGAIEHLTETCGESYRDGPALLTRVDALEVDARRMLKDGAGAAEAARLVKRLDALRTDALVKRNPLIDFDKLVFVRRLTYSANHYYTEYINSAWTPGGGLCMLDLKTGKVADLVPELTGGVFERFDVSFDATRIAFAWKCADQEGYRIYEIRVDPATGTRRGPLRQLTFPQKNEAELVRLYRARDHYHHGTDDMHPCYLPNGEIVFISTRCQYGILCDAPDDFTTTLLYRMDADGKNMRKLSNGSVSEASPVIMPDGRILYTRWEYVDKGAVSVKCLWAMRPDGSGSMEIYGNDISLPPTFLYSRPIPGAPDKYVFLGTPHCPQNGVGTVIRLDMTRDIRTRDPMTYMTPYVDIQSEPGFAFRTGDGPWRQDRNGGGPLFKDPYPLSEKFFLVSHKPSGPPWNDPKGYGLYLLDEAGKTYLIHRDTEMSCWLPYPLKPRKAPPMPKASVNEKLAAQGLAACVVSDIYRGLTDVKRGEIKYIRVLEQVPRPWASRRRWEGDAYDQQHVCITKDTHLGLKVQHGVVPVEADGSAHFVVPAMANIFFQALDANYMAVQTERTFVNFTPGETRSCVGCHETQKDASASATGGLVLALKRPASVPGPQLGEKSGGRPIYYPTDVQPVLDKHCIECHSGKEPKANQNLTGTMTALFSRSYEALIPERRGGKGRSRKLHDLVGPTIGENHPKTGNVHYMPAKSFGSHNSVLVAMLAKGKITLKDPELAAIAARLAKQHKDIRLTPEELLRITNWVDTNGQYYGSWWGRRNLQHLKHPNFRPIPTYEHARSMTSPLPEDKR